MIPPRLVLASQSSARKRLLKRLGWKFIARAADLDEAAVQRRIPIPSRLVRELSILKARTVGAAYPGCIIIGSDQVLVCEGQIFGKPGTPQRARAQLRRASGKRVHLLTGVCVRGPDGKEATFVHKSQLKFRKLHDREIAAYVAKDSPLDCAGSFKFESYGISLIDRVTTDDPTAIEGLPLLHLHTLLRQIYLASGMREMHVNLT